MFGSCEVNWEKQAAKQSLEQSCSNAVANNERSIEHRVDFSEPVSGSHTQKKLNNKDAVFICWFAVGKKWLKSMFQ